MQCCAYTLTQITAACTNIAVSLHSLFSHLMNRAAQRSPLLAAIHAGYLPGPSGKPLIEASSSQSLKRSHAKQKHISKVNISLLCCQPAAGKAE